VPKAAAPKSKAAPATKAKPKATSKKRVLVDHDDNVEESGSDSPASDASDDELPKGSTSNLTERKKKTASETYTKVCLSFLSESICDLNNHIAIPTRTHPQTPRFVHWKCRNYQTVHMDL